MTRADPGDELGHACAREAGSAPGAGGAGDRSGSEPGRELICALIEEQARLQRCRACGRLLRACTVAVRAATPERLDAAITCGACGATMLVTVRPTGGEGSAHIG